MPAKRKEIKVEEPLFVDEEGSYVHEVEGATYKGGIRRYAPPGGADAPSVSASPTTSGRFAAGAHNKSGSIAALSSAAASAASMGFAADAPVFRHGYGVYTCPSFTYTGEWVEDEMHGSGQLVFNQSGNTYNGDFFHGCFSGQGTYQWHDGAVYCGQWRANRMHGDGVYTDVQGHVWKGRYYNGTGPGLVRLYPTLQRVDVESVSPEANSGDRTAREVGA